MNPEKNNILETLDNVDQYLKFLEGMGCTGFECPKKTLDSLLSWGTPDTPITENLESIRLELGDCRRCRLCRGRSNIVFGAGDPKAKLVFVGEGPGYEEDKSGQPFVGAAGQLLTKIIEAIHLDRENVYICNILKCRPPENRDPEPDEINACVPFLIRQLKVIEPDFICALGAFASRTLLQTNAPISRLRGRFHNYNGFQVLPTYHPAYLLRNPDKKRDVWEDMKLLMKAMGI